MSAAEVLDEKNGQPICGLGPRGKRIHYFHEPGRLFMFFDPLKGATWKKMVQVGG